MIRAGTPPQPPAPSLAQTAVWRDVAAGAEAVGVDERDVA